VNKAATLTASHRQLAARKPLRQSAIGEQYVLVDDNGRPIEKRTRPVTLADRARSYFAGHLSTPLY